MNNKLNFDSLKEKINIIINKFKESKKFRYITLGIGLGLVIVIVLLFIFVGAPFNSVTINVMDQYEKAIDGLEITLYNEDNSYRVKFSNGMTKGRALDVKKGDYLLTFSSIPNGYTCFTTNESFTMRKYSRLKFEYECLKSE